ncbi:RecQ family ATP-dependent DNA helicase [Tenacibaculum jejuense]|uniref:ATP-dependent DNA helicase RecQ n=1 Tax=Tenacibaculum jejuense TaxID=584609 RepID=A0A238UB49_9FLAO|nr:ATP-dependent DNA helicase RecQ [Tenacibaculum jejuense]SNR15640.1 ATP-dependent DNA helicase RecQ [Tenacibaculum jejuense]
MNTPTEILKKYWGFDSFRPQQLEIIEAVLNNKDTTALLPTGGGKSICYQIPALIKEGVCIVISPLIALIQDQINSLDKRGIKAFYIPSGSHQDEIVRIFDNLKFGNYKFLYLSPERIQSKFIQEKIKQLSVSFFAVDEAHCISEWGHDFRPSYTQLSILKELKENTPVIALTATATNKVLEDIYSTLSLNEPLTFKKSFYKPNLGYRILKSEDKLYRLKEIFTKIKAPAIVYVSSRKKTIELSNFLNSKGFKATSYHGGLSLSEKEIAYKNWMNNTCRIIVATNAFGMGIDRADVKIVVHYDIPNSIENYVQEAGRAGRNNESCYAIMLTNESDIKLTLNLFKDSQPSLEEIKHVHTKLHQYFKIANGEFIDTGFDFNILDFCNIYNLPVRKVYNILQILNNFGIIELNHFNQKKSTLQFLIPYGQLSKYKLANPKKNKFIDTLLRMYGGLFEQDVSINEFAIAKILGITSKHLIHLLDELHNDQIVNYKKSSKDSMLYFLHPREDNRTINRFSKKIKNLLTYKAQKLGNIIQFIQNDAVCRNIQLLNYFNEPNAKECGICDVCLKKEKIIDVSKEILAIIKDNREISSREICEKLNYKERDILIHLRKLLGEEKIKVTNYNTYLLA